MHVEINLTSVLAYTMCVDLPMIGECGPQGVCANVSSVFEESGIVAATALFPEDGDSYVNDNWLKQACSCSPGWSGSLELLTYLDTSSMIFSNRVFIGGQPVSEAIPQELTVAESKSLVSLLPCDSNDVLARFLNAGMFIIFLMCIVVLVTHLWSFNSQRTTSGSQRTTPDCRRLLIRQLLFYLGFINLAVFFFVKAIDPRRQIAADVLVTTLYATGTSFAHISCFFFLHGIIAYHLRALEPISLFSKDTLRSIGRGLIFVKLVAILGSLIYGGSLLAASILTQLRPETTSLSLVSSLISLAYLTVCLKVSSCAFVYHLILQKIISDMGKINKVIKEQEEEQRAEETYNPFFFFNKVQSTRRARYQAHCSRSIPGLKKTRAYVVLPAFLLSVACFLFLFFPFFQHLAKYVFTGIYGLGGLNFILTVLTLRFSNRRKRFKVLEYFTASVKSSLPKESRLTRVASFASFASFASSIQSRSQIQTHVLGLNETGGAHDRSLTQERSKRKTKLLYRKARASQRAIRHKTLKRDFSEALKNLLADGEKQELTKRKTSPKRAMNLANGSEGLPLEYEDSTLDTESEALSYTTSNILHYMNDSSKISL